MSLYLRDLYHKEVIKISKEVKDIETEKERIHAVNPWYPFRSVNGRLGHLRKKLKRYKQKYEETYVHNR